MRRLSTRKKIIFALIPVIPLVILLEGVSSLVAAKKAGSFKIFRNAAPFINFQSFDTPQSQSAWLLQQVNLDSNYFVFDPALGQRFKPASWCRALAADEEGRPQPENKKKLAIDPHGFIANTSSIKARVNYGKLALDPRVFRILVSGGSTVAGWGASDNEHTWPALLEKKLNSQPNPIRERYERVAVINCGVFRYHAAQEITRFEQETIYINPRLVISFNGINETFYYKGNPVDYANRGHQYQAANYFNFGAAFRQPVLLPYTAELVNSWTRPQAPAPDSIYGFKRRDYLRLDAADLYLSKMRQFNALCKGAGIRFVWCFQPLMGVGDRQLTPYEDKLKQFYGTKYYPGQWSDAQRLAQQFYNAVRPQIKDPWQNDLTEIFKDAPESVYHDPRHYNDLGNQLVADWMFDKIVALDKQEPM